MIRKVFEETNCYKLKEHINQSNTVLREHSLFIGWGAGVFTPHGLMAPEIAFEAS